MFFLTISVCTSPDGHVGMLCDKEDLAAILSLDCSSNGNFDYFKAIVHAISLFIRGYEMSNNCA